MIPHLAMLLIAGSLPAGFRVPVDQATSSMSVQICVLGTCDSDSSPLGGFMDVAMAPMGGPSSLALRNFDVQTLGTLDFNLNYFILGKIVATGTGLAITHASPGTAQPFFPITAGTCTVTNVPYLKRGTVQYTASGTVCGLLTQQGQPCQSTIDLSQDAATTLQAVTMSVEVAAGTVHISGAIAFSEPIDADNPGLGTISGTAVLSGSAPLPAPGDFDGDADVDLEDFLYFQGCFNGPNHPPSQVGCEEADLDGDTDVDLADFLIFQGCFNGPNRPPACQ
jgi:hypothetical protein